MARPGLTRKATRIFLKRKLKVEIQLDQPKYIPRKFPRTHHCLLVLLKLKTDILNPKKGANL